ncbi:MAG: hypothetical protein EA427_01940 [Spirochaetaceae bacterium]|nr:MAG: hypothetical protein EA427_01940 [Spirochaetaceae bacterium]
MRTYRVMTVMIILFVLSAGAVAAYEQHAYIQLYVGAGGAMESADHVEGALGGFGLAVIPVNPTNDWVGRIAIDYNEGEARRERVRQDGFRWTDESTLRVVTGTFDMLYGPGFAAKDTFRYYVGGGLGFAYEELEFHDEDLSKWGLQFGISAGVQYSIFDAGFRLTVLPDGENAYVMGRFTVGIALGPFNY